MKKVLSLLLAFVLYLSLCACGNTAEVNNDIQKVQEITPWIFGEWYANYPMYFSDAPIMVIRENGSGSYQGKEATWTLSETTDICEMESALIFHFNDGGKYHFILDKVNDYNIDVMFQDMSTPEIVGGHGLISKEGLENHKQQAECLVGQWINIFDITNPANGEIFMEIRADGTCTVLGAEGVWGLADDGDALDYIYIKTAGRNLGIQLNAPFDSGYRNVYVHDLDGSDPTTCYEFAYHENDIPEVPGADTTEQTTEPSEAISPADETLAFVKRQMNGYEKIEKGQFYVWQPGLQIAFLGAVYENDCFYIDMELYCDKDPDQGRWQQMFGPNVYLVYDDTSWYFRTSNKQFTRMEDPSAVVSVYSIKNGETVRCRAEIFNCVEDEISFDRINQIYWRFELDWEIPKGGTKYYIDITEWLQ